MSRQEMVKIFEERRIRSVWDDKTETWYFSIVDIVAALDIEADGALPPPKQEDEK